MVLVGSGPSCEIGYPSWHQLAEQAYRQLDQLGKVSDALTYQKFLDDGQYPELFRQMERDLSDDRSQLINILRPLLTPANRKTGRIYELISRWPFACYLTTNYDDELPSHLARADQHVTVVRNRKKDFYVWRDGVRNIVQKLHSDLDHPNELILTSTDYERFTVHGTHHYFRDRLRSIFSTFNILVIGHSLRDPDLTYVLSLAKEIADPAHPIYFICTGLTKGQESELLERYNIVPIPYDNSDKRHSDLLRMLRVAGHFIPSRNSPVTDPDETQRPIEEIDAAMALSVYRRLQGIEPTEYLAPLILFGLAQQQTEEIPGNEISKLPILRTLTGNWEPYAEPIVRALDDLTCPLNLLA